MICATKETRAAVLFGFVVTVPAGGHISAYKTPTCGCC
jgi:hypothetical protein